MKEYDLRSIAKGNAEYITPKPLRDFLANKITKRNISILEPSIGSGQLLFELKENIKEVDGFDINEFALKTAKENFPKVLTTHCKDFITAPLHRQYDYAIANYPFSLKPTEEQREFIAKDNFLKTFYQKQTEESLLIDAPPLVRPQDIKGLLDLVFILKSFQNAQEGLYFAFPGIGYRGQEEKFRKYLIQNKFIKEIGILNNCKFDHTSISILFLHLTKEPNHQTTTFTKDLKTGELLEGVATFPNNTFDFPRKQEKKEDIDPVELEMNARKSLIENIKKELVFSQIIYSIDPILQANLPPVEDFAKEIIEVLKEYGKNQATLL